MKKWIALALALVMVFSLSIFIYADADTATVAIQLDKTPAKVGDTFTASVNLEDIASQNFYSAEIVVFYDPAVLQVVDGASGVALNEELSNAGVGKIYSKIDEQRGTVHFALGITPDSIKTLPDGLALGTDSATLFTISFKVIKEGDTKLQIAKKGSAPKYVDSMEEGMSAYLGSAKEAAVLSYTYEPLTIGNATTSKIILKISEIPDVVVDYGTSLEEVQKLLPETVEANLDDGTKQQIGITWSENSNPNYQPNTSSFYLFTGTLAETEGIENYNGIFSMIKVVVKGEDGTVPDTEPDDVTTSPSASPSASPSVSPSASPSGSPSVSPSVPPSFAFTDLGNVAWAKDMIVELASNGIISGTSDTTFEPDRNVTRAEFISLLVRAFGISSDNPSYGFADVLPGEWYYDAIMNARAAGVASGYEDETFRPNALISREDMAVMAHNAATVMGVSLPDGEQVTFSDEANIAGYARDAIVAMQKGGIISGMGDGSFGPQQNATRAQAAVIIYKLWSLKK